MSPRRRSSRFASIAAASVPIVLPLQQSAGGEAAGADLWNKVVAPILANTPKTRSRLGLASFLAPNNNMLEEEEGEEEALGYGDGTISLTATVLQQHPLSSPSMIDLAAEAPASSKSEAYFDASDMVAEQSESVFTTDQPPLISETAMIIDNQTPVDQDLMEISSSRRFSQRLFAAKLATEFKSEKVTDGLNKKPQKLNTAISSVARNSKKVSRTLSVSKRPVKPAKKSTVSAQPIRATTKTHIRAFDQKSKTYLLLKARSPAKIQKKSNVSKKGPVRGSSTAVKPKLTVPKPFKFHESAKTQVNVVNQSQSSNAPVSPFVPLAVKVRNFQSATPDRFKSKAVKRTRAQIISSGNLTQPKSPALVTKLRAKSNAPAKTTEEMEVEQLEKVQPFKAKRPNRKILHAAGPLGVPNAEKPKLTVPESPAITKPKPVIDMSILPPAPAIIKANPVPDMSIAFKPVIEHRVLAVPDFHLPGDKISQKKRIAFQEEVEQKKKEEEGGKTFVAQPLPIFNEPIFSAVQTKPPTQPKPFRLEADIRGAQYQKELKMRLECEEAEKIAQANQFRAQPLPVSAPFVPHPSDKEPTKSEDIVLHTVERAEDRKAFDSALAEKAALEAQELAIQKQNEEEINRAAITELRAQQTHIAQPIRHFKGVQVHPSNRPLTIPESPKLGSRRHQQLPPAQ